PGDSTPTSRSDATEVTRMPSHARVAVALRTLLARFALTAALLGVASTAHAQLTQTNGPNFGTFTVGSIEQQLVATGGIGGYTWSVVGGSLPPGVNLSTELPSFFSASASAGLIGVATTPGSYAFTLRVTSNGGFVD